MERISIHRSAWTRVRIDDDAMRALDRLRRGTQQPIDRLLRGIVRDYLDEIREGRPIRKHRACDSRAT